VSPLGTAQPRTRPVVVVAGAAALWAVVFGLMLGVTVNRADETWMLWVADRVAHGERLYRDVYDVTTPLAAWIFTAAVRVFGVELVVLRAVTALGFVVEVLLSMSIARWLGFTRRARLLLAATLVVTTSPASQFIGFYTSLAILFGLAALRCLLWWYEVRDATVQTRSRWLALAGVGVACGLCFSAKPNIGLLVGGGVLAALWLLRSPQPRFVRDLGIVAAAGAVTTLAVFAPVLVSGSWPSFVDQVVDTKGEYLKTGISYFSSLEARLDVVLGNVPISSQHQRVSALVLFMPLVVLPVLLWACARSRDSWRLVLTFTVFALVGLAAVYPRPGVNHFSAVVPLVLVATMGAVRVSRAGARSTERRTRALFATTCVLVACALGLVVNHSVDGYARPGYSYTMRHFTHLPIREMHVARSEVARRALEKTRLVFFLGKTASFFYLTTGVRNPLPYDIPEDSDLGGGGERGLIKVLASGAVPYVCLPRHAANRAPARYRLREVQRWVQASLEVVEELPACTLYRA
jgi:hypothetical protein